MPAWGLFAIFFSWWYRSQATSSVNGRAVSPACAPCPALPALPAGQGAGLSRHLPHPAAADGRDGCVCCLCWGCRPSLWGTTMWDCWRCRCVPRWQPSATLLIGQVARTDQQAAIFGSISVVILSALGGIWIPMFVMPHAMQIVCHLSPLNWG